MQKIQANVPGVTLTTPYPCKTFRELYQAHDPRWFLPKYKIWFCDRDLMGRMIVVRYDPRRGCIEGYQLLAISNRTTYEHWPADNAVVIHAFEPLVKLHLDKPVIQFHAQDVNRQPNANKFSTEVPMHIDESPDRMFCNFLHARPLSAPEVELRASEPFPYLSVWPPPAIPARHRVAGLAPSQEVEELLPSDRPTCRAEMSDQSFRVRQWMELAGTPIAPTIIGSNLVGGLMQMFAGIGPEAAGLGQGRQGFAGVHIGEEVITYATLDPVLYTPTLLKPWRGIWVGDYSGHGCEFLLINQPDDELSVSDEDLGLFRLEDETEEAWSRRRNDARVYRGRLEAIKLTGDPNVPRGEYTFVADDLGEEGFVGVAQEPPFSGTRVVRSKGHIARTGFHEGKSSFFLSFFSPSFTPFLNRHSKTLLSPMRLLPLIAETFVSTDKYIESQLLLISHNRLAQYWVGFGHISFFERVNIDTLLAP
jgi:hypothetical protein